jgi:hypothetical protein
MPDFNSGELNLTPNDGATFQMPAPRYTPRTYTGRSPGLAALVQDTPPGAAVEYEPTEQVPVAAERLEPLPATEPEPQACRCDDCKYGKTPGTGAVLYAGPDAVHLRERAAIREGRMEDATAYGVQAHLHVNADFDAAAHHIRATLAAGWEGITALAGRTAA